MMSSLPAEYNRAEKYCWFVVDWENGLKMQFVVSDDGEEKEIRALSFSRIVSFMTRERVRYSSGGECSY